MPVPSAVISVSDLLRVEQLVEARPLDVEDLAAQRQDRLELAVAALLGRAAGGVALDQVDLAQRRIPLLAVGELAGQAHAVEHALAARQLARLARRFARARGVDDLAADDLGVGRVLEQEVGELRRHDFLHDRLHFATRPACPWSASENLGSGTFTDSTQVRPSRMSSPVVSTLAFLASSSFSM